MTGELHLIDDDLREIEQDEGWVRWDVVDEHWVYLCRLAEEADIENLLREVAETLEGLKRNSEDLEVFEASVNQMVMDTYFDGL